MLGACGGPALPTGPSTRAVAVIARLDVDTSVTGGQAAHGTVTLAEAAPDPGITIGLAANNMAVTIPSSLTISSGMTMGSFDITTTRVAATTDVAITASIGEARMTSSMRVKIDAAALRPAAAYTLGFSSLRDNRAGFTTYNDSAFTVSVVSADWIAITTYGNPIPFIEFNSPVGQTTTGEIRITAGGAPFWFNSIDLYSSTTKIPYVFEGSLSGDPVFTIVNVLGNTFGAFARTPNPRSDAAIDTLLIRLSNPSAPCCSNPMGVDNIVLSR
jgi:hypothetical protein